MTQQYTVEFVNLDIIGPVEIINYCLIKALQYYQSQYFYVLPLRLLSRCYPSLVCNIRNNCKYSNTLLLSDMLRLGHVGVQTKIV